MNATELLEKIGQSLGSTATVKSVFGEPIQAEGKTVVPIAKVAYGFGAGSGAGPGKHGHTPETGEPGTQAEGGGGGGGVKAFPAGALEITATGTRFIPFHDLRWLGGALAIGALGGMLLRRRH